MATASGAVALLVALGCALLVSGWAVQTNKSRCAPTSDAHERVPRVRRHQSGSAIVGAAASTATVLTADLRNSYGSNTLAGVSCDIHNQAVTAWAVLDSSLLPAQRTAMLAWADAALMSFAASSCEELILRGWRVERSGRWYLLAFDGST